MILPETSFWGLLSVGIAALNPRLHTDDALRAILASTAGGLPSAPTAMRWLS